MIKGVDVQCIQKWKDLDERRQVNYGAIRLDEASLNEGKSHVKEMKFLCGYIILVY